MKTTQEKIEFLRYKIQRKQLRMNGIQNEIEELNSKLDQQEKLLKRKK
jgi:cell division protein FtsL